MTLDDLHPGVDARLASTLLTLQVAAYGVEAALIDDDRIPNLHETVEQLSKSDLTWLGAFDNSQLIGAIAYTESSIGWDIDRLFVDPGHHRRGVGARLVREVTARAGKRSVTVSTAHANDPAIALYESLGFRRLGEHEVLPNLWVTHLKRSPQ